MSMITELVRSARADPGSFRFYVPRCDVPHLPAVHTCNSFRGPYWFLDIIMILVLNTTITGEHLDFMASTLPLPFIGFAPYSLVENYAILDKLAVSTTVHCDLGYDTGHKFLGRFHVGTQKVPVWVEKFTAQKAIGMLLNFDEEIGPDYWKLISTTLRLLTLDGENDTLEELHSPLQKARVLLYDEIKVLEKEPGLLVTILRNKLIFFEIFLRTVRWCISEFIYLDFFSESILIALDVNYYFEQA